MLKRCLTVLLCLLLLVPALAGGEEEETREELLKPFKLYHGPRNSRKIAITVDDCFESGAEFVLRDAELCRKHGVRMTFFPLVYAGCLDEKYRDMWQTVLDCGCEIGTHTYSHMRMGSRDAWGIIDALGKFQEALDKTLGYHYPVRWLRPPSGSIDNGERLSEKQVVHAIKKYGFDHIVVWDVNETLDMEKAMKSVRNGSILLFHTKQKDTEFLEQMIPELLEKGFEPVTLSELFGFDPPEAGGDPYVYDRQQFKY